MSLIKVKGLALCGAFVLLSCGAAFAQTAAPPGNSSAMDPAMDGSGSNSVTTTTAVPAQATPDTATAPAMTTTTERHGFDLGWLGLFGLFGLLGLRKRQSDVLVTNKTANTRP